MGRKMARASRGRSQYLLDSDGCGCICIRSPDVGVVARLG